MSDVEEDLVEASDEEGDAVTAGQVLKKLEEAWITERMSPTLERHQGDFVDCMIDQITQMSENLTQCSREDFRLELHKMEIDRIRYVLSNYLRVRLEKIERFAHYILEKEEELDESESLLSPAERIYAKEYVANMERLFNDVVLNKVPENVKTFEPAKMCDKPNLDSYVFLKAKETTTGVIVEDETGEGRDEEVDLMAGSQYLMRYSTVKDFLGTGAIVFI